MLGVPPCAEIIFARLATPMLSELDRCALLPGGSGANFTLWSPLPLLLPPLPLPPEPADEADAMVAVEAAPGEGRVDRVELAPGEWGDDGERG